MGQEAKKKYEAIHEDRKLIYQQEIKDYEAKHGKIERKRRSKKNAGDEDEESDEPKTKKKVKKN